MSLMAINLFTNKEVHVKLDQSFKGLDVDEYLFTPDGNITSRFVLFNFISEYFSRILLLYSSASSERLSWFKPDRAN